MKMEQNDVALAELFVEFIIKLSGLPLEVKDSNACKSNVKTMRCYFVQR